MHYGPLLGMIFGSSITSSLGSGTSYNFNAADDSIGYLMQSPGTTMIDRVAFRVQSVSTPGSAGDIECEIQGIDASGHPDGTKLTNSNTGTLTVSTTGVKEITGIAGTATIAKGQYIALVLNAGTGWNRSLNITLTQGTSQCGMGFPHYRTQNAGGGWGSRFAGTNSGWCMGIGDSSGDYMRYSGFAGPWTAWASTVLERHRYRHLRQIGSSRPCR